MKRIVVEGVSFSVCDVGSGKPIILLHGFPLDHSMWNDQIGALSDTYRVIAPDLRGHGSSEVTAGTVTMRQMADDFRNRLGSGVVMLAAESDGKVLIAIGVTKDLTGSYKAGDLIRETAKVVGGGGGGRADFAQAGGKDASKIDAAIEKFYELVGGA